MPIDASVDLNKNELYTSAIERVVATYGSDRAYAVLVNGMTLQNADYWTNPSAFIAWYDAALECAKNVQGKGYVELYYRVREVLLPPKVVRIPSVKGIISAA